MKGATTTATRMTRATCWVLTSARRAPTRGARKGLAVLLLLEVKLAADDADTAADDDDEGDEGEGETTFLFALRKALPTSLPRTETT